MGRQGYSRIASFHRPSSAKAASISIIFVNFEIFQLFPKTFFCEKRVLTETKKITSISVKGFSNVKVDFIDFNIKEIITTFFYYLKKSSQLKFF